MTSIRKAVENYLAMRRALGFKLRFQGTALIQFVAFLEKEKALFITADLALRWAKQSPDADPAQWAKRLSFVRGFARYWSASDPRTEIPPKGLLPHSYKRKAPHFYTDEEIEQLLKAARHLPPSTPLQRWTYPTLFGLMAVTGMRVSEALALQQNDVDLNVGLLTIRLTKFNKSRLIPIHPSTCEALRQFARQRNHIHTPRSDAPFFVSRKGTALPDYMAQRTFAKLSRQIGLRKPSDRFGPRLHALRHSFAIKTLMDWYRSGVDVERRLPVLSTYLGHANVTGTYWYLTAVPELLTLTVTRLEKRLGDL
jgi:integrase/recombinase XerD